jgi:hypothetical protein
VVERLPQRGAELVVVPRLGDQAVDLAAIDGVHRDVDLGEARQHEPHDLGMLLPHRGQQVDARGAGHALVRDDDLGGVLGQDGEGLAGAGRRPDLDGLAPQQAPERPEDVHLVVHEEDGVLSHGLARAWDSPSASRAGPVRTPFLSKGRAIGGGEENLATAMGCDPVPGAWEGPERPRSGTPCAGRQKAARSLPPGCRRSAGAGTRKGGRCGGAAAEPLPSR